MSPGVPLRREIEVDGFVGVQIRIAQLFNGEFGLAVFLFDLGERGGIQRGKAGPGQGLAGTTAKDDVFRQLIAED